MSKEENLCVVVRVRPFVEYELERKSRNVFQQVDEHIARLEKEGEEVREFYFDHVFMGGSRQEDIYEKTAFMLVENAAQGFNTTVFAYGQTGCGKSFTMIGDIGSPEKMGIIPRAFHHFIDIMQGDTKKVLIHVSFIEIYNEEIKDLLATDVPKRDLKESPDKGVFIKDLLTVPVRSVPEMFDQMKRGDAHRSTAATKMNEHSSRSHCIFTIYYETIEQNDRGELVKVGKMNLVDLAGSERQSKTKAEGDRLKEANKINLSLTALGNVISALVERKKHIPFRDSKLTRLLQDSLGGNSKTLMIAACSPADYNFDETLSTLRYASRARKITNKPKVNEDPKEALIKEYASEIERLKRMLEERGIAEEGEVRVVVEKEAGQGQGHDHDHDHEAVQALEEERRRNAELKEQLRQLQKIDISQEGGMLASRAENVKQRMEREAKLRGMEAQLREEHEKEMRALRQKMEMLEYSESQKHNQLVEEYKKVKRENELLLYQQDSINKTYTDGVQELECENDFLLQALRCLLSEEQIKAVRAKARPVTSEMVGEDGAIVERVVRYEVKPFYLVEEGKVHFPQLHREASFDLCRSKMEKFGVASSKPSRFMNKTASRSNLFRSEHSHSREEDPQRQNLQVREGRKVKLDSLQVSGDFSETHSEDRPRSSRQKLPPM
jgi:hypothetical protein